MDLPAARRGRTIVDGTRGGGAAPALGCGESALGLRAAPGRAGQTRPPRWMLDRSGWAQAPPHPAGTAAPRARRLVVAVPRTAPRCRPGLRLLHRQDALPEHDLCPVLHRDWLASRAFRW